MKLEKVAKSMFLHILLASAEHIILDYNQADRSDQSFRASSTYRHFKQKFYHTQTHAVHNISCVEINVRVCVCSL